VIFLARHGETDYNAEGRFQGQGAVPLNARGREQAHELAEAAEGHGLRALWSSPLPRALETARIVGARLELEPRADARFMETGTGRWTDRLQDEVAREEPEAWAAYNATDPDFRFPAASRSPSRWSAWWTAWCRHARGAAAGARRLPPRRRARGPGPHAPARAGDLHVLGRRQRSAARAVTLLVRGVFALLVAATFGAFFLAQRLKNGPTAIQQLTARPRLLPERRRPLDEARWSFRLREDDDVSVEVVDADGDTVRTLADDRFLRAYTPTRFRWDGRDDAGRSVPDGRYRLRIALRREGRAGVQARVTVKDTVPPRPRVISVGPSRNRIPGPEILPTASGEPVRVNFEASGSRTRVRVVRTAPGPHHARAQRPRAAAGHGALGVGRPAARRPARAGRHVRRGGRDAGRGGQHRDERARGRCAAAARARLRPAPARPRRASPCATWPSSPRRRPCSAASPPRSGSTPAAGRGRPPCGGWGRGPSRSAATAGGGPCCASPRPAAPAGCTS
jgi:broad specificity phosphatase PhoE